MQQFTTRAIQWRPLAGLSLNSLLLATAGLCLLNALLLRSFAG